MWEQDYILRMVREMVRVILKMLFNMDLDQSTEKILQQVEQQRLLQGLLDMAQADKITQAQEQIEEMTATRDKEMLKVAVLFYAALNEQSEEFLTEHHFSREDIRTALREIVAAYEGDAFAELFLT